MAKSCRSLVVAKFPGVPTPEPFRDPVHGLAERRSRPSLVDPQLFVSLEWACLAYVRSLADVLAAKRAG